MKARSIQEDTELASLTSLTTSNDVMLVPDVCFIVEINFLNAIFLCLENPS